MERRVGRGDRATAPLPCPRRLCWWMRVSSGGEARTGAGDSVAQAAGCRLQAAIESRGAAAAKGAESAVDGAVATGGGEAGADRPWGSKNFDKSGFEGASLVEIVEAAGMTEGA